MKKRYRIVYDRFAGYEVQVKRWWWPFYLQADFVNTHFTIEDAELFAQRHARGEAYYVKDLGKL